MHVLFQKNVFFCYLLKLLQLLPLIPLILSIRSQWFDLSQSIHWILQFLSPPLLSKPWPSNLLLCISICLSFASSPPPPPHWATTSFTQPVSRVLQVHILSKRQTFHSLFIETITLWDCCGDSTLTTAPPHWSLPPPRCSLDSTFIHYLSLIVGFRYIIEKRGMAIVWFGLRLFEIQASHWSKGIPSRPMVLE